MVSLILNKLKIKTTTIELFGITRLSVKVGPKTITDFMDDILER